MIKKNILVCLSLICGIVHAKNEYSEFFTNNRFRINYTISGNSNSEEISDISIQEEEYWGGSRINLIDTFEYGEYFFKVFDLKSNSVIYSRGYSNLFSEWQTTNEAQEINKSYRECIIFPAPKNMVLLKLYKRDANLIFQEFFTIEVIPDSIVYSESNTNIKHKLSGHKANSASALDVVIVSEGYINTQQEKFFNDVYRFAEYLFSWEPYNAYRHKINIHGVFVSSIDDGVDIPNDSVWRNTSFDASFGTFNINRYLTVPDITKIYDKLIGIPIDQICVLVNSELYGGGGIYNYCNVFTSNHSAAGFLFMHEFGHSFAGLADEYFSKDTIFQNYIRTDIEPIEPNITSLINFERKWQNMVNDSIPIPTPDILLYENSIGVFEGAAYKSKNVYRPARNCAMRSSTQTKFCNICIKSIENMILFYSE